MKNGVYGCKMGCTVGVLFENLCFHIYVDHFLLVHRKLHGSKACFHRSSPGTGTRRYSESFYRYSESCAIGRRASCAQSSRASRNGMSTDHLGVVPAAAALRPFRRLM